MAVAQLSRRSSNNGMQADEQHSPLKIFHLFYVFTGFIFNIPAEKNK